MSRTARFPLSLACAVGLLAAPQWAGALTARAAATRTSGVAPLAVFFDATGSSGSGSSFHDVQYTWDFADPNSGRFATDSKSRNQAFGPLAGHVFETPGSYAVKLTASDATGAKSSTTVTIQVASPSSLTTTCFANNSLNWSDPGGACNNATKVVTSSFDQAIGYAAPGRRLLFRRGDTFTQNSTQTLSGSGPVSIGAFGSGARPKVDFTIDAAQFMLGTVSDWRIADLELVGSGKPSSTPTSVAFNKVSAGTALSQFTLLRLRMTNYHSTIAIVATAGAAGPMSDEIAFVDSVAEAYADSGRSGNGVRIDADHVMVLGSVMRDNEQNEYNFRTQHLDHAVIADNVFERGASLKGNMTIRGCNWFKACGGTGTRSTGTPGVGDTQFFVVSDNLFRYRLDGVPLALMPQNTGSFEVLHDALIERNRFEGEPGASIQRGLKIHASDVTVRNNLFDMTHFFEDTSAPSVTPKAMTVQNLSTVGVPTPSNVSFENNTIYQPSNWSGGAVAIELTSGSNHSAVNNLFYAPGLSKAPSFFGYKAGLARDDRNVVDRVDYSGNPFGVSKPVAAADFTPRSGGPADDAGVAVAGNGVDLLGDLRPSGGAMDLGAVERVTGTTPPAGQPPAAPVLLP